MRNLYSFFKSRPIFWISITGTSIGAACLIKDLMQGGQYSKETDESGKVVIVTGSNTGIGKETVRELARRGATVYMACRNLDKCKLARDEIVLETHNRFVYCAECDLSSLESVQNFVEKFKREQTKLHILVNNAGVMRCPRSITKNGFEQQLGVNHLGHFLLTNLLLDRLKESSPSRIINVSSLAHTRGEINVGDLNSEKNYNEAKAYNQSKLANVLFTRELAKRLQGTGVTVNALHPGVVDTEIFRHMGFFNNIFASLIFKPLFWPFTKTPKNGAQTTLYVALENDLEKVTGKYFSDCEMKDVAPVAKDDQLAQWLWAVSEKWTGLRS